jgi:hypothetical protein
LHKYGKEIAFFRQLILEGQWEDAENFLKPLKLQPNFDYDPVNTSSTIYILGYF